MHYSKDDMVKMFLHFVIRYTTVAQFAADYEIDVITATSCINRGRVLTEAGVIEKKEYSQSNR